MLVLQLVLYCLLFIFLVKCAAGNNGIHCLYFGIALVVLVIG